MAKKVIANLNIQLSASSATLKQDFDRAGGAVKKLEADVNGAAGGLDRLAGVKSRAAGAASKLAGMATAAVGALAALTLGATLAHAGLSGVVERFAALDEAAETGARLGTTADALLAVRHAAQMTGTDVESVDKGLGILLRKLSDASHGGQSAGVFAKLGLSVEELQRLAPEEMLARVADRIAALPTASERAGAAFALFGKQGEGLLNLLSAGGDAIREYAEEADALGLTLGQVDASKISAANDEWDRAKAAFTGLANQIAVAVAPAAGRLAEHLTRLGVSLANLIETNRPAIEAFALSVVNAFGKVVDGIVFIHDSWVEWVGSIENAQLLLAKIGDAVGRIASGDIGSLFNGPELGADWLERQKAAEAEAAAQAARAKAAADAAAAFAEQQEAAEKAAAAVAAAQAETQKWADVGQRLKDQLETPMEEFEKRARELQDAFAHGAIPVELLRRGLQEAADTLAAAEESADKMAAAVKSTPSVGAAVRGTAAGFGAVQSGQDALRDMREAMKRQAESDKRREALQQRIADAMERVANGAGAPKINVNKVSL